MTATVRDAPDSAEGLMRRSCVVWIDAREAVVIRWHDGQPIVNRLTSDVPAHRRATGHVRHDPAVRHGGGGSRQTAGDPHRLEHLQRFIERVADRLAKDDDLLILGPGTVREHLERFVADADVQHLRSRAVRSEASPRLTDHQLIARLRRLAGAEPARRTVGAYRWTGPLPHRRSGQLAGTPRRVATKPQRRPAI